MSTAAGFSLVYLAAAAIATMAAVVMWRRREAAGAVALTYMLLAAAFWAVCDAIELHVSTVDAKRLVSQIQYLGVVAAAPCFFHAARALARLPRASRGLLAAVWGIPLLSLLVAWTNQWHAWLWTAILPPRGESPFATYVYGWWFWVLTAQTYLLMIASTVILLRAIRTVSRGFRMAMTLVLIAVILPWIGNAMYNAKLGPWEGFNWLTLSLGVSGCLLVWVVLREGLLDLLPQARGALIDMMTDAVVVLDRGGRVIFGNRTAADMLGHDAGALAPVLAKVPSRTPSEWRGQSRVDTAAGTRWLDIRVGPVLDRWGGLAGRIVVARDVTAQKGLEDERERLVDELRAAVRRVTQLEGLLPICANCRNVRDGNGSWRTIEDYLESRTPLEFTHGICPSCMKALYPEMFGGRAVDREL